MPDPDDAEMKAAIRYASARTVGGIVEELQARFGPDRAWPWDMVKAEVAAQRTGCSRKKGYGSDGAIARFIADRAYLVSNKEIAKAGAEHFAPQPFPSKSEVHRIIQRQLEEDRSRRPGALKRHKVRPKR